MADQEHVDDSVTTFKELGINSWLVDQCQVVGISRPTPIQINCIPEILKGRDCLASAKTGSGKTAAFALPILQLLSEDPYGIFALIVTPTRELAYQIGEQFEVFGKPINVRVTVITGGINMIDQGLKLTDLPHIVVTTPGRLADHLESCDTFNFNQLRFLVMDEADRLLEDNFGEQLETIFNVLPEKRQTLLFSATFTESLSGVIELSKKKPFVWHSESSVATVEQLNQTYVLTPADMKDAYMVHIVDQYTEDHPTSSVMIFTNTCKYCQIIGMIFNEIGIDCVVLHSMMSQRNRLAALAKFKSSQVRIIIATDVASRGLDIPMVDLIINHNIPNNPKNYVHRVGRTARAGRGGTSVSFVTQFDVKLIQAVESYINTKLSLYEVNEKEVTKILVDVMMAKSEAEIVLDERNFGEYKWIHKRKRAILEGEDPDQREKERRKKRREEMKKRKEAFLSRSNRFPKEKAAASTVGQTTRESNKKPVKAEQSSSKQTQKPLTKTLHQKQTKTSKGKKKKNI
ncbi:probable ATP-dependent RNA helicase DDX49 isoform X1 [Octopus sinensis]|uniref:RNA helicase n=1 Tax=Octopus sinensis TaxID=2607531 RepID=A0A6P7U8W1_9MOLL|nr:probable ATP-dependent RNA helicase DDX49 isoform X1 [Octopus sinensis]